MPQTARNLIGLVGGALTCALLACASLFIGSKSIAASRVWEVLNDADGSIEATVVHDQRIPRMILVILVGMALGVAGALMQSLTRNPLADPGVLGVNAGASIAVVAAVAIAGVTSIWFYLWFAFIGAALASVAVYVLGGAAGRMTTPARLALAGVAISMAVSALVQMVILSNQDAFNEFRLWAAGSVEGRGWPIITAVAGFIVVGVLLAWVSAPGLNAVALGDDAAAGLGVKVGLLRAQVMLAVTLLAGAATAAVGPIMFIGLGVPYLARAVCGPDQRWAIPLSAVLAPSVMLLADIVARVIVSPAEIQTGIITAILGGPVFIAIIRLRRIEAF